MLLLVQFVPSGFTQDNPAKTRAPQANGATSASPATAQLPAAKPASEGDASPGGTDPDAGVSREEEDLEAEAEESEPAPPPLRGNSLARQTASVQRQLGRRRQQGGFFVSRWFSDAPVTGQFSVGSSTAPAAPDNCDPVDATVAEAYIRESARREGISSDLVREVIRIESGFNPCAVSPKGAIGMMQLMPETAASLGVEDPFNPRQNIDGGVRMLKRLLDKYKGRPDLALAAYNAGEGAVDANQGVPAYEETKDYVSIIMKRVFEEPAKPARALGRTPPAIPHVAPAKANQK